MTDEAPTLTAVDGWEIVLEHDRIPFISYPYEWPFSMLQDAALLQLDLLAGALQENLVIKDATPYNVQWRGARPVFVDIGSFQPYSEGEPWIGYRQFCRQFLYPLMLRAFLDVPFQPWLRGDLEGMTAHDLKNLLSWRDRLRPGVLPHVVLQARAERRYASSDRDARSELKAAGFKKKLIETNVARLHRLVASLKWDANDSTWSDYADDHSHVAVDRDVKTAFVDDILRHVEPRLVWDLGANDGHFSRLAAGVANTVVALDGDEVVLDRLYRQLSVDGIDNVLPLVVDLANPSPGQGWAGEERQHLVARGRPDLVLCLAVLHHLVIGRNVPVSSVVEWLTSLRASLILEFATVADPMVQRLLVNKREGEVHPDYDETLLRSLLERRFTITRERRLPSGNRILLYLTPVT